MSRRFMTGLAAVAIVVTGASTLMVTSPLPSAPGEATPVATPAATWSTDGKVWDMVRIGGTIYLGGEFTRLVSPDGAQSVPRANLAAVSASSGQPVAWAPAASGPVLALESSADGSRVFVGGHFQTIGGMARSRLASVRTSDGTVDPAFTANTGGRVRALLRQGDALYIGGEFGNVGAVQQRLVARLDAATGAVVPGWDPRLVGGAVRGLAFSPDGARLYLAGSFTSVDEAATTRYSAALDAASGELSAWRAPIDQPLFDIAAAGDAVYLAVGGPGIPNNRLQKHSAASGAEVHRYIGDGDLQDLEVYGTTLFVGAHFDTDFNGLRRTMVAAVDLRDDQVLDWAPRVEGLYGVWKILAGPEGIWLAGELTRVGGQNRGGFAFLPQASSQPAERRLLLDRFGTWRYRPGSAPADWSARTFDDTTWASGRAEIGYGDGDELTRIAGTHTLYLRRQFSVTDPSGWRALRLRLLADAGAAVYLNGTEVARDNLPSGPLSAETRALTSKWTLNERLYIEADVPAALLVAGVNTVAVSVHTANSPEDLSFALELLGEPKPTSTELVGADGVWRVLDTGTAPPATWWARSFDPVGWRWGQGEMGAGDGDETTVINRLRPAHITDWFRHWFPVPDRTRFRWANLRLLVDDGAVVYLNGTEIVRDNLPAGTILPSTNATTARMDAAERTWRTFAVPVSLLRDGSNLLAVEVHQTGAWDPDSSFALRLQAGA